MQIFITGTDTDIGKTLVSSWLCLHSRYDYLKPIQTGSDHGTDSETVKNISGNIVHPEIYLYQQPLSPHLAAIRDNIQIDLKKIMLPPKSNLIVEGAGGVMTPLNKSELMIDLIAMLALPVILVVSSRLGTINHTLLTLEALNTRKIKILGVIISGSLNQDNAESIEYYGKIKILMQLPYINCINKRSLADIKLSSSLQNLLLR